MINDKTAANEANGIVQRLLTALLNSIVDKGDAGVQAKITIGFVSANAALMIYYGYIGAPLDACFDLTRQAGATLNSMETCRILLTVENPQSVGATIIRDRAIQLCLAQEAKIISSLTFNSRQDVDELITAIQVPFDSAEETAADTMDGMDYMAIISLRASIVNYLVSTARPLPSMLNYQFAKVMPSLVISQKLYGDASRYDQIRNENKIVHPAFCPTQGQALSQ
jgi:prophage DNA circulation protein